MRKIAIKTLFHKDAINLSNLRSSPNRCVLLKTTTARVQRCVYLYYLLWLIDWLIDWLRCCPFPWFRLVVFDDDDDDDKHFWWWHMTTIPCISFVVTKSSGRRMYGVQTDTVDYRDAETHLKSILELIN